MKDILKIFLNLRDGICITRMERHGDHGFDLRQIDLDHAVIVSHCSGFEFFIIRRTPVYIVEFTDAVIGLPDRTQAGGLCSHDIDAYTEVRA